MNYRLRAGFAIFILVSAMGSIAGASAFGEKPPASAATHLRAGSEGAPLPWTLSSSAGGDSAAVLELVSEERVSIAELRRPALDAADGPRLDFSDRLAKSEAFVAPLPREETPPGGADAGTTTSSTFPARTVNFHADGAREAQASWSGAHYKITAGLEAGVFDVGSFNDDPEVPGTDDVLTFKAGTAGVFRLNNAPLVERYSDSFFSPRGSTLSLSDDSGAWVSLGRYVKFLGNYYDRAWVCSNGYVKLGDSQRQSAGNPPCVYSGDLADKPHGGHILAPYFKDLNPSAGGAVRVSIETFWTYIQWDDVPLYGSTSRATFEILFDGTFTTSATEFIPETPILFRYKTVPSAEDPFVVNGFHQKMLFGTGKTASNTRDDLWMKVTSSSTVSPYTKVLDARLKMSSPTGESIRLQADSQNGVRISGMNLKFTATHENHVQPHHDTGSIGFIADVVGLATDVFGCFSIPGAAECILGMGSGLVGMYANGAQQSEFERLQDFARHASFSYSDPKSANEAEGAMVGVPGYGYPNGIRHDPLGVAETFMVGITEWHLQTRTWGSTHTIRYTPYYQVKSAYMDPNGYLVFRTWNVQPSSGIEMSLSPPSPPDSCFSFSGGTILGPSFYVSGFANTADASCSETGNGNLPNHNQLRHRWDWDDGSSLGYGSDGEYEVATKSYTLPGFYDVRLDVRNAWDLTDFTTRSITVI